MEPNVTNLPRFWKLVVPTKARRWRTLATALVLTQFSLPAEDLTPVSPTNQPAMDVTTAEPGPSRGRSYDDFKIISERNIFDPNRRARTRTQPEPERTPEPQIDIVALTGTLSYSKGTFAFFDSNSSEFRKTARVGDQVAGFTLKEIEQSHVQLERESKLLELKVGQQLRRQDESPWELTYGERLRSNAGSSRGDSRRPTNSSRSYSSNSTQNFNRPPADEAEGEIETPPDQNDDEAPAAASDDSGDGPSEVLRRLLEQRRKEQEQ